MTTTTGHFLRQVCCLVAAAQICINGVAAPAQVRSDDGALSEAVRVLAREQSLAEQYAVIMRDMGQETPEAFGRGIQLYAEAKAEFDGLIEQLKYDIRQRRSPAESKEFKTVLATAAAQRFAFTQHVNEKIICTQCPGTKKGAIVTALIKSAGELIEKLTDSGIRIWREYQNARDEERKAILTQLDALKWRPIARILAVGKRDG